MREKNDSEDRGHTIRSESTLVMPSYIAAAHCHPYLPRMASPKNAKECCYLMSTYDEEMLCK